MHLPPPPQWQVVSEWVNRDGKESVEVVAFDTFYVARTEAHRLGMQVGDVIDGQFLKCVELVGDFKSRWEADR